MIDADYSQAPADIRDAIPIVAMSIRCIDRNLKLQRSCTVHNRVEWYSYPGFMIMMAHNRDADRGRRRRCRRRRTRCCQALTFVHHDTQVPSLRKRENHESVIKSQYYHYQRSVTRKRTTGRVEKTHFFCTLSEWAGDSFRLEHPIKHYRIYHISTQRRTIYNCHTTPLRHDTRPLPKLVNSQVVHQALAAI